jgi:hypothetical protein
VLLGIDRFPIDVPEKVFGKPLHDAILTASALAAKNPVSRVGSSSGLKSLSPNSHPL